MPCEFFRGARRERPIFYHAELDAYVLTRYRDGERILEATSDGTSRPSSSGRIASISSTR